MKQAFDQPVRSVTAATTHQARTGNKRPRPSSSSIKRSSVSGGALVTILLLLCYAAPATPLITRSSISLSQRRTRTTPSAQGSVVLGRRRQVTTRAQQKERSLSSQKATSTQAVYYNNSGGEPNKRSKAVMLLQQQAETLKEQALAAVQRQDFAAAIKLIRQLITAHATAAGEHKRAAHHMSECIDCAVQAVTEAAFSAPFTSHQRVAAGNEALQLQLSVASVLSFPYDRIPRRTYLNALKALTTTVPLLVLKQDGAREGSLNNNTDIAFRLLQRLITGIGVRHANAKSYVAEKEFNLVLNAYSNAGRMDRAEQLVALQQKAASAQPVSPVGYSILLKGYGRLEDLAHVEGTMEQAVRNKVDPDTVMLNSLMDAYINCNASEKALALFAYMKNPDGSDSRFAGQQSCPRPNRRTYNTILKGLAMQGALKESLELSREMKEFRLWDAVTTNTLVHAAVGANAFELAEQLLAQHTVRLTRPPAGGRHPNVEAYTELLDSYAKNGQMDQALSTLQLMRKRGVEPNEITYTCLIGGLGRHKRIDQAKKMLAFMSTNGFRPKAVTYNALISGLVGISEKGSPDETLDDPASSMDAHVDESLKLLGEMMKSGVRPNAVTVSVLVDAMGKCQPPRVREAKSLVDRLERGKLLPAGNAKVVTALVQTCGLGGELNVALEAFRKLQKPDLVAINAFLDACCRCNRERLAEETFDYYFRRIEGSYIKPDVISYSVLISALLKREKSNSSEQARVLYREMKTQSKIFPDTTLIDIVLKGMVRIARSASLSQLDVHFLANVLRDAEKLEWAEGQFELRERTVRAVAGERLREVWKKYGWNDVDSGFRII